MMFPSLPGMLILLQLGEMTVCGYKPGDSPVRFLAWVNGAVMSSTDIPYGIHYLVNVTILPRIKSSLLQGFQQLFSEFVFSA